jgi:phosphotriesterase-related protein
MVNTTTLSRRHFLQLTAAGLLSFRPKQNAPEIVTVLGPIPLSKMGTTLVHEHFLVDFIGADIIQESRWKKDEVVQKVMPYLQALAPHGVKTVFDCTPAFLGRDVKLLVQLAKQSGLNIVTNTGYYGAVQNKYLPAWAHTETAEQLATRWTQEFKQGIDGTTVKPGFIKISVDGPHLSPLHQKLVRAAALTHLQTGLTICSHTGSAIPAFEQLDILQQMKVSPRAFVWTHAQVEKDISLHSKAAKKGAWISLDGIGWGEAEWYAETIAQLKKEGWLKNILLSHDAGWYKPGETNGGEFKGYTNLFTTVLPLLRQKGFTMRDIYQLLVTNPAQAFGISVRKM